MLNYKNLISRRYDCAGISARGIFFLPCHCNLMRIILYHKRGNIQYRIHYHERRNFTEYILRLFVSCKKSWEVINALFPVFLEFWQKRVEFNFIFCGGYFRAPNYYFFRIYIMRFCLIFDLCAFINTKIMQQ